MASDVNVDFLCMKVKINKKNVDFLCMKVKTNK